VVGYGCMGAEHCDGVVVGDGRRREGTLRRPEVMRKGCFNISGTEEWCGSLQYCTSVIGLTKAQTRIGGCGFQWKTKRITRVYLYISAPMYLFI